MNRNVAVDPDSLQTVNFEIPENTSYSVSVSNDSLPSTDGIPNYFTLVETSEMYEGNKPSQRIPYDVELGDEWVSFHKYDDCIDELADLPEIDTLVIDNVYIRVTVEFFSENEIDADLFECLTDSCTTKITLADTVQDTVTGQYFTNVSVDAIDGESVYVDTISDSHGV